MKILLASAVSKAYDARVTRSPLVLGWGDDASAALRRLEELSVGAPHAELLDGGGMAPSLLNSVAPHRRVLLLCTLSLGGLPGSVYRFRAEDLQRLSSLSRVREAMAVMGMASWRPKEFFVLAVEPGDTPEATANSLADSALLQLQRWAQGERSLAATA
jgi:hypothetical protein